MQNEATTTRAAELGLRMVQIPGGYEFWPLGTTYPVGNAMASEVSSWLSRYGSRFGR